MKGIILAGGHGTRLSPLTTVTSKQLLPVYNKPMIYYPLTLLMLGKIRDILIITTDKDQHNFKKVLGDGKQWGLEITYKVQDKPGGLPEAFTLGEEFIGDDAVTLILGDNLFHGDIDFFKDAVSSYESEKHIEKGGIVFAYPVSNPGDYGVVDFNKQTNEVYGIEEKPLCPKSNYALTGLYIFDSTVIEKTKSLRPSSRGETEITDIMKLYLQNKKLHLQAITRGVAWLDMGTPKSLLEASTYIAALESRHGLNIGSPEEIALRMGYLSIKEYDLLVEKMPSSTYKENLLKIRDEFC